MTEYICKPLFTKEEDSELGYAVIGEVVRCRDYKHYERDFEGFEHWCLMHAHPLNNTDGFCAWGERI